MWSCILTIGLSLLIYYGIKRIRSGLHIGEYIERHVLITGCDTGFGNLLTKRLDRMGFNVFACCLTSNGQKDVRGQCSSNVVPLLLDITKDDNIQCCLQNVKQLLRGKGLWGIVNNAGIVGSLGPLEMLTVKHIEQCVDVNLFGMIRVTKAFLPLIRKSRGRIINTSSMTGRVAISSLPYTVSKYGIEGFSDRLRRELYLTGVTVHIIEPGAFQTPILDVEKVCRDCVNLYEQADDEVQEFYGRQYVDQFTTRITSELPKRSSPHLWKVVDAYVHALTARYPMYRYIVGKDAFIIVKLMANFPEWLQDWLFSRMTRFVPDKCKT